MKLASVYNLYYQKNNRKTTVERSGCGGTHTAQCRGGEGEGVCALEPAVQCCEKAQPSAEEHPTSTSGQEARVREVVRLSGAELDFPRSCEQVT